MNKYTAKSKYSGEEYNGDILSMTTSAGTIYYIRPDDSDYQSTVTDQWGKTWFGVTLIEVDKESIKPI